MMRIASTDEERRLRVLLGSGMAPGWPRRTADRWILLRRASGCLAPGEDLDERALTVRLSDWLAGEAAGLGLDAAELRRGLVDEGFLDRDLAGRSYRHSERHRGRVRFESASAEEDS